MLPLGEYRGSPQREGGPVWRKGIYVGVGGWGRHRDREVGHRGSRAAKFLHLFSHLSASLIWVSPLGLQDFSFSSVFFLFLKLYFIDYAITVVPNLPHWPPPPCTLHSLRQSPHYCSCPRVTRISSLASPFPMLYFTSPWLFCDYLYVLLNPLYSSPIPPHPSHLATIKTLSVSMILSLSLFA